MNEPAPATMTVTDAPAPDDLALIAAGLSSFNDQDAGPADKKSLAVLLRDPSGRLVGGLAGYTAWGWLYVQWLWLEQARRGQGLAHRLLAAAESEARARGCHGSYIDTFNPVALKTYRKAGYVPFGELLEFPRGRTRTFLSKPL